MYGCYTITMINDDVILREDFEILLPSGQQVEKEVSLDLSCNHWRIKASALSFSLTKPEMEQFVHNSSCQMDVRQVHINTRAMGSAAVI